MNSFYGSIFLFSIHIKAFHAYLFFHFNLHNSTPLGLLIICIIFFYSYLSPSDFLLFGLIHLFLSVKPFRVVSYTSYILLFILKSFRLLLFGLFLFLESNPFKVVSYVSYFRYIHIKVLQTFYLYNC